MNLRAQKWGDYLFHGQRKDITLPQILTAIGINRFDAHCELSTYKHNNYVDSAWSSYTSISIEQPIRMLFASTAHPTAIITDLQFAILLLIQGRAVINDKGYIITTLKMNELPPGTPWTELTIRQKWFLKTLVYALKALNANAVSKEQLDFLLTTVIGRADGVQKSLHIGVRDRIQLEDGYTLLLRDDLRRGYWNSSSDNLWNMFLSTTNQQATNEEQLRTITWMMYTIAEEHGSVAILANDAYDKHIILPSDGYDELITRQNSTIASTNNQLAWVRAYITAMFMALQGRAPYLDIAITDENVHIYRDFNEHPTWREFYDYALTQYPELEFSLIPPGPNE